MLPAYPNNVADGYIRLTWGPEPLTLENFGTGQAPHFSTFTVDVLPAGPGDTPPPISPGRYAAWCIDAVTEIDPTAGYTLPGTTYGGAMYSTCDPTVAFNQFLPASHPGVIQDAVKWKQMNYLINHRLEPCDGLVPTMWEVRRAMAFLFGQVPPEAGYPSYRTAVVDCLLAKTIANAASWVPVAGDKVAVIFNIDANWTDDILLNDVQVIILEVPLPSGPEPIKTTIVSCSQMVTLDTSLFTSPNGTIVSATFSVPSGTIFPFGNTTVNFTATDSAGNIKSGTLTVIIIDADAPVITPVANIVTSIEPGGCTAKVEYSATVTDCNLKSVVYSPASGSVFPIGTTTVTITATDNADRQSTSTFTVTVNDTEAPVLHVSNIQANVTADSCTAIVTFTATADDCTTATLIYSLSPTFTPAISSGATFPIGITTVYVKATDVAGNSSTSSFVVTVVDDQAPVLSVSNIQVNVTPNTCGANVTFSATATDCSSVTMVYSLSPTFTPAIVSGANFPLGTTVVYVKATDLAGNSSTGSFNVTVVDNQAPVITVNNIQVNVTPNTCGANVTFSANATDCTEVTKVYSLSPTFTPTITSGANFPVGTTIVFVKATDVAGNSATSSFTVKVVDNQAPMLTSPLIDFTIQNHTGKCYATFTYIPTASDNCTGVITMAVSPASGTQFAAGTTTTVTVIATDSSGNSVTKTFKVTVPICLGSLGNFVWYDTNKNGLQDTGELGVDGVKVTLFTSAGVPVGTPLTTSGGGFYRFDNLIPGNYYVIFDKTTFPAGYVLTTQNTGANDATDSDANPTTGKSEGNATVVGGQYNDTVDAGLVQVPPVVLVCAGTPGTVGTPYTAALVASGGTAPYTYSISAGSLPPGLTLNPSTGAITGTPTSAGTYNYTGKVVDSTSGTAKTATYNCSITIAPPVCVPTTFTFNGNTALSGTVGNIRTFTVGGISVKASAFSRVKGSGGAWAAAYLGAYSGGLGVTDTSESGSGNTHTTDNIGRDNYVLFEFSQPVVINRAYLGYVVNDSDLTAWVGNATNPYVNHITPTDAIVGAMTAEEDLTDNGNSRWASLNAGGLSGNVLIIAARLNESSPNDEFKIAALEICQPAAPALSLACVSTVTGNVGVAYASSLVASGGKAPYTYSISAGSLPPGLVLASSGAITGVPTAAGVYSFTAKVTDSTGGTALVAVSSCNITITNPVCVPTTFTFSGSTSTTGTAGNIRTFTVGGISVKASAFSRVKGTGGAWAPAYLGAYSGGLGVTDTSENGSGNAHTTDNIGRDNFVLFEFSQPVVVNRAYLGYVVTDSDLSAWVGNASNPYTNHLTLSNTILNGLTRENNLTDSSSARWAKLNGQISGNVLIIAADLDDSTPDDQFKIAALDICQPSTSPVTLGCVSATTGTKGTAYSSFLRAEGGTPGYTYSIISGALPGGLTLNPTTGAITGIPTTTGAFTFTAKVVDSKGSTGTSAATVSCCITIAPSTAPAGPTGKIGSFVWKDSDGDGVQDGGELGLQGVTVQLKNSSGVVIATDITDSSGEYEFTGLAAGTYTVVISAPSGYTPSPSNVGSNDSIDSDGSPEMVTLATNSSSNLTIDFGFVPPEVCAKSLLTYTQGGWGSTPRGNNPGAFLTKNFSSVYPYGFVGIGSTSRYLVFTSAAAVSNFLPQGGTPGVLTGSATNPSSSKAGVLAGQVLALQLNVDFSNSGRTSAGLGAKKAGSGPLAGKTVKEILALGNSVISGGALPSGLTLSKLNEVLTAINENYDNGNTNDGYLY